MNLGPDTIIELVETGGGVVLDLNSRPFEPADLVRIAAAAAKTGARVTVRNPGLLSPDLLVRLAAVGKGRVTFEL